MKKRVLALLAVTALTMLGFSGASAHQCDANGENCQDTPMVDNWRDAYIPLFDLENRDDPEQRRDAQRWREECNQWDSEGGQETHQICQWSYGGLSFFPNRDGSGNAPNEWHFGFAASHCFLFEFAHQCEDHYRPGTTSDPIHDSHGGAIYIDVCLTPNSESKWCNDGMADTQIGITIVDHNGCGTFVPVVACTDEYHVLRPFEDGYTQAQVEDTLAWFQALAADPANFLRRYICGFGPGADDCIYPG